MQTNADGPQSADALMSNLCCLYVALANVFVAQMWVASWSCTNDKLTVKQIFGNSAVVHSVDMAQPSESSLGQDSEHAGDPCTPEYLCVRYFVLPCDSLCVSDYWTHLVCW